MKHHPLSFQINLFLIKLPLVFTLSLIDVNEENSTGCLKTLMVYILKMHDKISFILGVVGWEILLHISKMKEMELCKNPVSFQGRKSWRTQ